MTMSRAKVQKQITTQTLQASQSQMKPQRNNAGVILSGFGCEGGPFLALWKKLRVSLKT